MVLPLSDLIIRTGRVDGNDNSLKITRCAGGGGGEKGRGDCGGSGGGGSNSGVVGCRVVGAGAGGVLAVGRVDVDQTRPVP